MNSAVETTEENTKESILGSEVFEGIVPASDQENTNNAPVRLEQDTNIRSDAVDTSDPIYNLLEKRQGKLVHFLNGDEERFLKLAYSYAWEINTRHELKKCTKLSILQGFYKCCEYNLDPSSALNLVWMWPYGNKLNFSIGYRGLIKLISAQKGVASVYSYPVYDNDEFEYTLGLNPTITHKPGIIIRDKQKELIATYGVVKKDNGESLIKVCDLNDINKSKRSSKSFHEQDSPWNLHYEEMALIIPIRKLSKIIV